MSYDADAESEYDSDAEDVEYGRTDEGYVEDDEPLMRESGDNPLWDLDDEFEEDEEEPPPSGRFQ